jgi:hypothetical protein
VARPEKDMEGEKSISFVQFFNSEEKFAAARLGPSLSPLLETIEIEVERTFVYGSNRSTHSPLDQQRFGACFAATGAPHLD